MPDFKIGPYTPPPVKVKGQSRPARKPKTPKAVQKAVSTQRDVFKALGFAPTEKAADARAKEIVKQQAVDLDPSTAFKFNTGVEKAALDPKRKQRQPNSIEGAMEAYDLEKYGRKTYGKTDDPERKAYLTKLQKDAQDRKKLAPHIDEDAKYQNPKSQFAKPLVDSNALVSDVGKVVNKDADREARTAGALIPVQPREKMISSELADEAGGILPNSGPGSPKSFAQYQAQGAGNIEGVMAQFDVKHYGKPTYGENESPERRRFRMEYERMAKFDKSPYSAVDLAIASRGKSDKEKLVWDRAGTKQVPFSQALRESEKAMGLDPGALNIERIRNSDAFVWQLQREGPNAGGQLASERGMAEASGVKYKEERANEGDQNLTSFLSGGMTDVFEGTRRMLAGESWESIMDTRAGRMASLVGDRLGIGSGETTDRAAFAKSQDNAGIGDATNFDLGLMSVSDAIGGVNSTLTQAGTGRSSRNLTGKTRAINAGIDFAQEMVLSLVGGGAIAGPGKTLLGTLGRGFVAENIFDAPDYIQMVRASGLVEGTKEFTLALMNQFNPAVLFDPKREIEEKVVTGISLALLGLGKGADVAMTRANNQVMDKAWGDADLGEVRKHIESAAFDMLRKTNVTSLLPGDIRKQAKYVAFQYLTMGTEIYGDNVQVGNFIKAATDAMKDGSLETVVKQAMDDAKGKEAEAVQAQEAQVQTESQEVDEGIGADDVAAALTAGEEVSLSAQQWKGLADELVGTMLQMGVTADESESGDVVLRAQKVDDQAEADSAIESQRQESTRGPQIVINELDMNALRAQYAAEDAAKAEAEKSEKPKSEAMKGEGAKPETMTESPFARKDPVIEDSDKMRGIARGILDANEYGAEGDKHVAFTLNGKRHYARFDKGASRPSGYTRAANWKIYEGEFPIGLANDPLYTVPADVLREYGSKPAAVSVTDSAERDVKKPIGKNAQGLDVYENADGVRSYSENGFRISEPVAIIPTRAGMETSKSTRDRTDEFKTTDELAESETKPETPAIQPAETPETGTAKEYEEGDRIMQRHEGAFRYGVVTAVDKFGMSARFDGESSAQSVDPASILLDDQQEAKSETAANPYEGIKIDTEVAEAAGIDEVWRELSPDGKWGDADYDAKIASGSTAELKSRDRLSLAQRILAKLLMRGKPAQGEPIATFVIGGPGSGKSYAGKHSIKADGALVDADEAKRFLPEYYAHKDSPSMTYMESVQIAEDLYNSLVKMNSSFVKMGTGADFEYLKGLIDAARAKGYKVHVHFVDASTETAVARVAKRVADGGHGIPHETIVEKNRLARVSYNRIKNEKLADEWAEWDTSSGKPVRSQSGSLHSAAPDNGREGLVQPDGGTPGGLPRSVGSRDGSKNGRSPDEVTQPSDQQEASANNAGASSVESPAPARNKLFSRETVDKAREDYKKGGGGVAGAGFGALAAFSPAQARAAVILAVDFIEDGVRSVADLIAAFLKQGMVLERAQALDAFGMARDLIDGVMTIEAFDSLTGILTQESDGQTSQLPPSGTGSPNQVQPDDGVRNDDGGAERVRTGPRDSGRGNQGSTRAGEADDASGSGVVRDAGDSEAADGRASTDDGTRGSVSGRAGQYRLPQSSGEPIPRTNGGKAKALVTALEARRDARDRGWATAEEQAALIAFPGWGFSKNWFQPGTKEYDSDRGATIRDMTTKDEAIAARLASRNSHYTSVSVVKAMHSALEHLGITDGAGLNVLEPAVGSGLFYAAAPDGIAGAKWSMVELDDTTAEIAKFLYPKSDVQQTGFQKTRFKSGSFNVVISNVPFSEVGVFDGQMSEQLGEKAATPLMARLHNYFFAKSVDLTAPGGIIAFITTHGSLDASDDVAKNFRQFMHENTEFLGAVRLPNNAFGDSANTEVVTDIIILRRRGHGGAEIDNAFLKAKPTKVDGETYMINEWFLKHPSAVLGQHAATGSMHGANEYTVAGKPGVDLGKEIAKAFRRQLPKDGFVRSDVPADVKLPQAEVPVGTQVGEVYVDKTNSIMRLSPNGIVEPMNLTAKQEKVFRDYLDIKAALNVVLQAQSASDADLKAAQTKLAKAYDKFVKAHGNLQAATTSERVKIKDKKPVLDGDGDPVKTTSVSFKHKGLLGRDSQNARVMALEVWDFDNYKVKGKADIFTKRTILMEQSVKNLTDPQDLLNASLNVKGKIDIDWMRQVTDKSEEDVVKLLGDLVIKDPAGGYSDRQEYLSGNIKQKIEAAKALVKDGRLEFSQNVKLLEAVMPEPKEYQDVAAEFGAKWIPDSVYEAFFEAEFPRGWGTGPGLRALRRHTSGWEVENAGVASAVSTTYGVAMRMDSFVQHVMNRTTPKIYDTVDKSRVLNKNKTDFAIDKAREVREKFTAWLDSKADHQAAVTDAFNTEINVFVPLERGTAHLSFEGLNVSETGVQLRPHRLNAISMAMAKPFTLWWHGVGSGKTFTATMLAMKLKQTGLRNKVVLVTYKPTLEQFIADAYVAYPNARILAAHEKSFAKENRTEFLASMATGDWDMVIITQEQLAALPLSPDKTHELFTDLITTEIVRAGLESEANVKTKAKGRGMAGKLAKRIESIILARDEAVSAAEKRMSSGSLAFDSIGIDHIIVDEAHMYKGLPVTTETDIGLSASARAMDLYVKVSYLRGQKGGMTAMTGTALVNSSAEIYNWFRFLDPETLAQIGGTEFDDFATNFLRMESEIEVGVSGAFKSRARVRGIVSLPVLAEAFAQSVDVVPTHEVVTLPKLVGGKPFVHVTPADAAQKEAFAHIAARYKEVKDRMSRGEFPGKGEDNFLSLSMRGRLASQDARFYFPDADDSDTSKSTMIADNVTTLYKQYHEDKAAQIIFMDFGIPGKASFDAYGDMVKKLAARGIPKAEIALISDARNAQDRARIAARVRSGEVRVLIGSRAKLGVGLNIQNQLIAVHHQAIGWNPAMLEQGNARLIRYGNRYKEVEVHYYVVAGTYDQITGNATMAKGNVFTQLVNGMSARNLGNEMDEAVTEEGANSMAEVMAVAMGDPRIVQMVQLAKDFDRALARSEQARRALTISEGQIELFESTYMPETKARLAEAQAIQDRYLKDPDAKLELNGVEELPKAGGEAGVLILKEAMKVDKGIIGKIGDFNVRTYKSDQGREGYGITFTIDGIKDPAAFLFVDAEFVPSKEAALVQRLRGYIASKYNEIPELANHAQQVVDATIENHRQYVEQVKKGVPESYVKEVEDLRQKLARLEFDTDLSVKKLETGEVSGFGLEPAAPTRVDKTVELAGEKYEILERTWSGTFWVRKPDGKETHFNAGHPLRPQIQNVLDGKDPMDGIPVETEGGAPDQIKQLNLRTRPQLDLPNLQASPAAPAVPIAPITGQRPKRKDQIILDLNKALGSRKVVMGTAGKSTVGNYLPRSRSRWIRGTTDLVTTSHELIHEVDDRFGIFAEWALGATPFPATLDQELQLPEFQGSVAEGMADWQVRAEQLAEWGRALIMNPDATRALTPELSAHWDKMVPERARDAIMAFSDDLRAFAGATGREAIIASMDTALDGETGKGFASWWNRRLDDYERFRREATGEDGEGNFRTTVQDRFRVKLIDDMAPAVSVFREVFRRRGLGKNKTVNPDLPAELDDKENPNVWMRRLPYLDQIMSGFIDHGFEDIDGQPITGSVAEMFAELDNTSPEAFARDFEDMSALLMAERQIELGERIDKRADQEIAEATAALYEKFDSRLESYGNRLNRELKAWLDGSLAQLAAGTNKAIKETPNDDSRSKSERRILDKAAKEEKILKDKAKMAFTLGMKEYTDKATARLKGQIDSVSAKIRSSAKFETQGQFAMGADGVRVAMQDARDTIKELEIDIERYTRLKEAVRRYREFGDWTLQTLVDHGLLSEADRITIRDANQYWFSAQRVMDDDVLPFIRSAAGLSGAKPTVKKKGMSGRITSNVIDNLLEQMYNTLNEATRNSVLRTWTDLMAPSREMYGGVNDPDFADLATELPEGADPTPTTITFYRDGKKELWDVTDKALYETLARIGKGADDAETRFMLNVLAMPTTVLRNTITLTPAFALRNLGRDTETRAITNPYRNSARSFAPRMPDQEMKRVFATHALGAGRGTHLSDADNFAKVRQESIRQILVANGNVKAKVRNVLTWGPRSYMRMLEAAEKKNRAEVYQAAYDYAIRILGRDSESAKLYAAHEARSTMTDFRRAGQWSRKLNRFIPFFNAAIQGQSASWTKIAQNPAKSMTRLMVWSTIMISLERAWASMMDDDEDREQTDPMQRDLFFRFKIDDDLYVSVPKPHDLGLVTSALDRLVDYLGGDQHAFEGAAARAFNVMSPAGLDDALGPAKIVAEIGWNRNFFTGNAIVSPYEEHLAQDLRKGAAYASPMGKRFAKYLGGDPRQWDHFLRGQFGNVGRAAIDISRARAGERAPGTLVSLTGLAANAPMYGARDVQWVLQTAKSNGIGKTRLDELQGKYYEARDAATRDKLAGEIVSYAKRLRVEMEAAMKGKAGKDRADALRGVVSAAKKDQKSPIGDAPGSKKFSIPKFKIGKL